MTTANKITLVRIFLIPVFVAFVIYYGESSERGQPDDSLRYAAVAIFLIAAASDGVDGWIARRFNQRSRLGSILDPIADKGLLLSAIITLSLTHWPSRFPLWFPILVITRDAIAVALTFVINHVAGSVTIAPHWTGKVATVCQMTAIGWLMLQIPHPPAIVPTALAGVFTFVSGMVYLREGLSQLHGAEGGE